MRTRGRIALALVLTALLAPASAAWGDTFEVNSIGDAGDFAVNGSCDTDAVPDDTPCTLRAAIDEANDAVVDPAQDTIGFNIGSNQTIGIGSPLNITGPVSINGCASTSSAPCVGVGTTNTADNAVNVSASNVTIRGLAITHANRGISYGSGHTGLVVRNNRLGVKLDGTAEGNEIGIALSGSSAIIGGDSAAEENVISNNAGDAIEITGAGSIQNIVARNRGSSNGGLFLDLNPPDGTGNNPSSGPNSGIQAPTIQAAGANGASGTAQAGATVRVFSKSVAASGELEGFLKSATADGSGNWSVAYDSSLADGQRITATQTDTSNNTSELVLPAVTTDAVAPDTTITSGPPNLTNDSTPTFELNSPTDAGATFECKVDGGGFTPCTSPHTTSALTDGSHGFDVRAVDPNGNRDGTPAARSFSVDTAAPPVVFTWAPLGTTTDDTPIFAFESEPGATFQCRVDSGSFAACASPHTTAPLDSGPHGFEVKATDSAGNSATASWSFTVDTSAPETMITRAPKEVDEPKAKFRFASTEPGSSFLCKLDRRPFYPCTSPKKYKRLQPGRHVFQVSARDLAGNIDFSPAKHRFQYAG